MAKKEQEEAFEKIMASNHSRMIDFVKFAETKNAALLTFCSIWIGAIINLLRSPDEIPFDLKYGFIVSLPLLAIAAVISLKSLLPSFLDKFHKRKDDYRNLLYFADIAKGGTKEYANMAKAIYMPEQGQSTTHTYLHDLGVQTAIHASIAHDKFRMFQWSGTIVLLAFICIPVPPLVNLVRWAVTQLHC